MVIVKQNINLKYKYLVTFDDEKKTNQLFIKIHETQWKMSYLKIKIYYVPLTRYVSFKP